MLDNGVKYIYVPRGCIKFFSKIFFRSWVSADVAKNIYQQYNTIRARFGLLGKFHVCSEGLQMVKMQNGTMKTIKIQCMDGFQ